MIVGLLSDPVLRTALQRAAAPDEDVVFGDTLAFSALRHGFARLLVQDDEHVERARRLSTSSGVCVLTLHGERLVEWERDRLKGLGGGRTREYYATERLRALLRERTTPSWVDTTLRDISRAAGHPLPPALRGFGRRVMEFPLRYNDLHAFGRLTDLSRGALKARFRRRGLASPSAYLRWFRVMAAAHVLRVDSLTMLEASTRLGFTNDGNFCRSITSATGLTPTAIRAPQAWQQLIVRFAVVFLGGDALDAWRDLGPMFQRNQAA
jgi:AraC-like DNA-binding protein